MSMNYQPGTSSGLINVTAGTQVVTGPGVLLLSQITSASGASGSLVVYDGTSTSGTVLSNLSSLASTSINANVEAGVVFNVGLYVVVSGTGATGLVCYRRN